MRSKPLSQWADEQGIPRRTAYNWAKSGRLTIPLHRTRTGRLMVLDEDGDPDDRSIHPFIAAYAEELRLPVKDREAADDHSPILEAWAVTLYNAVAEDLRPVVLQLAVAASCQRPKRDVPVRFADWIGRIELADWYDSAGLPEAALMVRQHGEITNADTLREYWPTRAHSSEWRQELAATVTRGINEAGLAASDHQAGAAEDLCEAGLAGLAGVDGVKIAGERKDLRCAMDKLAKAEQPGFPLPDRSRLSEVRALYRDPMKPLARPITLHTARVICDLVGWDPDSPSPPIGHPLHDVGSNACAHAAATALAPQQHAAHLREIDAFRRIALGKPFVPAHP